MCSYSLPEGPYIHKSLGIGLACQCLGGGSPLFDERIAELIYVEKKKMRAADISELIEIVSSSRTLKRGE